MNKIMKQYNIKIKNKLKCLIQLLLPANRTGMFYNYLKKNILLFLTITPFALISQEIGIGEWRDHLPYENTVSVTASSQKIYCATPYSLFYLNKSDNSINRLTRISGLSDIGIVKIGFSKDYNTLLIAYSNTNLDLIKGNTIINMRDILNSSAVTPEEKVINNLIFIDNLAYLSCGFGIVVLDMENEEIVDTYYIGPNGIHLNVLDLAYNDTSFFAATESGIYMAYTDSPNLAYFGSWSKDESLPFPNATYSHITFNQDKLFVNKYSTAYASDTILYCDNSQWNYNNLFQHGNVKNMRTFDDVLYITHTYYLRGYTTDLNEVLNIWTYNYEVNPNSRDMIVDDDIIWIADGAKGLVRRNDGNNFSYIYPNGPQIPDVFDMSISNNKLWVVAGGRNLSWNSLFKYGNTSSFIDEEWNTFNRNNTPALDSIRDLVVVAVNPTNSNQVFMGSWSLGMVEFENQEYKGLYTPENSGLNYKSNEGPPVCKVGGLAFDNSGNLWATSSYAERILSVRLPDGSDFGDWYSFNLGSFSSTQDVGRLIIDSYDQKWIMVRAEHSLIVFNDNGTITQPGDDQVKILSSASGNGAIPGNKVFSIANDNDGEIWIGTDEGISVIYSPENVFSNYNFDAQRILIPRNDGTGLADILLEFETVTAIAVDGANNKWIGTDRSGVFHLSPDGQKELQHFTEQNSPLFSNNITSISINQTTGEVFFGTAKGIISYKSTATGGSETIVSAYAYPNPVRSGYNGPIAIIGLPENADFKITDISGKLVYSGIAQGGQAIWYGTTHEGRRVQTGVYMVFVTDINGPNSVTTESRGSRIVAGDKTNSTLVTKILFIN